MMAWIAASILSVTPARGAHVLVAAFDSDTLRADRSDFGQPEAAQTSGFRLTALGEGCLADPAGRALDAGYSPEARSGCLAFALPTDADLRQGRRSQPRPSRAAASLHWTCRCPSLGEG